MMAIKLSILKQNILKQNGNLFSLCVAKIFHVPADKTIYFSFVPCYLSQPSIPAIFRPLELAEYADRGEVPIKHLRPLSAEQSAKTTDQQTSLSPCCSSDVLWRNHWKWCLVFVLIESQDVNQSLVFLINLEYSLSSINMKCKKHFLFLFSNVDSYPL